MHLFLWWALLVAVVGDFAVPYLLAPFYRGYRHMDAVMSVLGNQKSPVRWYYRLWLVLLGVLLIGASTAVAGHYWAVSKPLSIAVAALIVLFALGAGILSGLFSVNETKEQKTLAAQIHGYGAAIGFMALLFVPLILGILSIRGGLTSQGVYFLLSFVAALIFFGLFVMADKPKAQGTMRQKEGLWQRLTLLFLYLPLGYLAVTALRL